jgi:hypothetical protein
LGGPGVNKIIIESRRKKIETIQRKYPDAIIIDVTSKGEEFRFSPFYPHGGIPVPFWSGQTSQSMEAIWQGLKVFEREGTDPSKFKITTMKGLKRPAGGKRGRVQGHRKMDDKTLLDYRTARQLIYVPTYIWLLENRLAAEVQRLRAILRTRDLVLLDHDVNEDIDDLSRPLSHASLIKRYILGELG